MKTGKLFFLLFLIVICISLIITGCINGPGSSQDTTLTYYNIGFIYPTDDDYCRKVTSVIEAFAEEDDYASLFTEYSNNNTVTEADKTDLMLETNDVDYLVVIPADYEDVSAVTNATTAAGVPVIFLRYNPYETEVPPDDVYFTGFDPDISGGEVQINYLAGLIDEEGSLCILRGPEGDDTADTLTNAYTRVINEDYPDIEILETGAIAWDTAQSAAETLMSEWLTEHGNAIDAVIANSDELALGAVSALISAERTDVVVVGFGGSDDALDAIIEETMTATVGMPPESVGDFCADLIKNLRCGTPVSGKVYHSYSVITVDNAADFQ